MGPVERHDGRGGGEKFFLEWSYVSERTVHFRVFLVLGYGFEWERVMGNVRGR